MPPSAIERDIHNTLAYFAYNQYPLTIFEIFKWQYKPERVYSYDEIQEVLQVSAWLKTRVGHCEGMYALGTDLEVEQQVAARKRRFLDSVKKQKKACKVIKYLSYLPSVKAVAICNSLAYHFTREKSDIDLFVITKRGRVWTARMWSVFPLLLLRQRPGETKKDPVDISFFVDEDAMSLEHLQIDDTDPYLAFWIRNLTPVYGRDDIWEAFFQANKWTCAQLPNAHYPKRAFRMRCGSKMLFVPCLFPERFMKWVQLVKLPYRIKMLCNESTCVVMNDKMLKFHTTDRREEIARAHKKKCV